MNNLDFLDTKPSKIRPKMGADESKLAKIRNKKRYQKYDASDKGKERVSKLDRKAITKRYRSKKFGCRIPAMTTIQRIGE